MKKFLYSLFFILLIKNSLFSYDFGDCEFFLTTTNNNTCSYPTPYIKPKYRYTTNYVTTIISDNKYVEEGTDSRWNGNWAWDFHGCKKTKKQFIQKIDNYYYFVLFEHYVYQYDLCSSRGHSLSYSKYTYTKADDVYIHNDDEFGFHISSKDEEVEKTINDLDANSRKAYACAVSGMGNYTGVTLDYLGGALASLKNKNGISFKNLLLGAKGLSSIISSTPLNDKKAVACAIRCSGGDLKINESVNSSSMCSEKSISDYDSSVNSAPVVEVSELSELEKKAIQATYNNCVINYDTCMLEASKNDESYYNQLSDKDKALIDSLLGEYENSQILIRDDENNVIGAINNGSLVAGTLDENGLFIEDKKDIVVTLPNMKDKELVLPNENDNVAVSPDISIPNNKEENDKIQLPNESTKPNEDVNVGEVVKPNEITKPNENVDVGEIVKPNEITKPNENVNVGEVVKPNEITKPNEAVKPDEVVITKPSTEVSINKENSKVNVDVNVKVDDITIKLDDSVSFVDDYNFVSDTSFNKLSNLLDLDFSGVENLYDMFVTSTDIMKKSLNEISNLNLSVESAELVQSCSYEKELKISSNYSVNVDIDICNSISPVQNTLYSVFKLFFFGFFLYLLFKAFASLLNSH